MSVERVVNQVDMKVMRIVVMESIMTATER